MAAATSERRRLPMDTQGLSMQTHFATVTDPRKAWNQDHRLSAILVMALCGIICGADSWVSVAAFAQATLPWFRRFLDPPNGAPSHDTFARVFAALDPTPLPQAFRSWVQAVHVATNGEVVAIDGKVLRGSADKARGPRSGPHGQRRGACQSADAGPAAGRRRRERDDGGSGAARTPGADRRYRHPGRDAPPDRHR
jgi:hypothetical protein